MTAVRDIMTTDVLTFAPGDSVADAIAALVDRGVDAGPVLDDGDGRVLGMLSTGDLIVQETQLHAPTVISLLGASIELPSSQRHLEADLAKALGATVGEVMASGPVTCRPEDSVEAAATLMHDHQVSRLPVVADGALVGIVARGDILRAIIGRSGPAAPSPAGPSTAEPQAAGPPPTAESLAAAPQAAAPPQPSGPGRDG